MPAPPAQERAEAFLREVTARIAPLEREAHLRAWEVSVHTAPETEAAAADAEAALDTFLSDRARYDTACRLLADPELGDPILRRQLELYRNMAAEKQLREAVLRDLVRRSKAIEAVFYSFRPELDGRRVSNNEILTCLKTACEETRRCEAWEASKQVGREVAEPLRELARRRNEAARSLGYRDYYDLRLRCQEIDEHELLKLFADLKAATDEPFRKQKERVDACLARRYGLHPRELRPWHYEDPFFQEAPQVLGPRLDRFIRPKGPLPIARAYARALGFEIEPVLERSDLYEREAKDQHAFCIDIDREGDVRMLGNLEDDLRSLETLLHELGHAAYCVHMPRTLPWLLRAPAHMSTTEAVAMWMGRTPLNPEWLATWVGFEAAEAPEAARAARELQRFQMLLTARWVLVMTHFERAFYGDPDRRDLDWLWWDLVEEFQHLRRPEKRRAPDWAAKIHLATAPVYYHNYLLGELSASQFDASIRRETGPQGLNRPEEAGAFFREQVFALGASLHWQDLLRRATGRRLSPDDFLETFAAAPSFLSL